MPGEEVEESNVDLDTTSALAEISEDLFGQDDSESGEGGALPPEGGEAEEATTPPPAEASEENTPEVQAVGAPQTWTKEAIGDWARVPPRAQQEILKREEDMFRGLEQYREKAELGSNYDRVIEPYRAALAAENIDPVGLFQSFAGNHYLLSRGTPEQKVQIAASLISSYGIDLTSLVTSMSHYEPPNPEVLQLRQELGALRSGLTAQQTEQRNRQLEEYNQQVTAFASDPSNSYFQEVSDDMIQFLKTGAATSLSQAYEMAVWNNPNTRNKELERLTAEKAESLTSTREKTVQTAKDAQAANVKTRSKTGNGTIPVGTLDETLEETMSKIAARG